MDRIHQCSQAVKDIRFGALWTDPHERCCAVGAEADEIRPRSYFHPLDSWAVVPTKRIWMGFSVLFAKLNTIFTMISSNGLNRCGFHQVWSLGMVCSTLFCKRVLVIDILSVYDQSKKKDQLWSKQTGQCQYFKSRSKLRLCIWRYSRYHNTGAVILLARWYIVIEKKTI